MSNAQHPVHVELSKDDKTLWVNGPGGLIGRFGVRGIDIHLNGACSGGYCTHGLTDNQDWETFKRKMLEIHGVKITDEYKPDRLILDNS